LSIDARGSQPQRWSSPGSERIAQKRALRRASGGIIANRDSLAFHRKEFTVKKFLAVFLVPRLGDFDWLGVKILTFLKSAQDG
jgi:hypothetical protein